jgi:UDPglucose 6-dehydrogenase
VHSTSIGVVGLGKLGLVLAANLAAKGDIPVLGFDVSPERRDEALRGVPSDPEPKVEELLRAAGANFRVCNELGELVQNCSQVFVVVPTPSLATGKFDMKYLVGALEGIGQVLQSMKNERFDTVIVSTVLPGDSRKVLIPALERASRRKVGPNLGFAYAPAFIALGSIVEDLSNPDLVLIGADSELTAAVVQQSWTLMLGSSEVKIHSTSIENAEIAKISLNSYITTKISFANVLTQLCDQIPGSDIDVVTEVIGSDSRVGHKYFTGGMTFSGPCFPRDNQALVAVLKENSSEGSLPEAVVQFGQNHQGYLHSVVYKVLELGYNKVVICGLSYKPNTTDLSESPSLRLIDGLQTRPEIVITVADPLIRKMNRDSIPSSLILRESLAAEDLCDSVVIISTRDDRWKEIDWSQVQNGTIIDPWRLLRDTIWPSTCTYRPLGIGTSAY